MTHNPNALEPCPWCGGSASFEHLENTRWSVGCLDIDGDCMGFQSLQTFSTKAEAIAAWNTRARPAPASDEVRERVARALLVSKINRRTPGYSHLRHDFTTPFPDDYADADAALSAIPADPVVEAMTQALELARPIVEVDHCGAKEHCDADWEGMSYVALMAIDAALEAYRTK